MTNERNHHFPHPTTHSSRFLDSNLLVLFSSASTVSACCVLQSFSWGKIDQLLLLYMMTIWGPFQVQKSFKLPIFKHLLNWTLVTLSNTGSHFHKYCTNRSCGFTRYYGYYTTGGSAAHVLYNHDWESLPYFVSSRETVFCMQLLRRVNAGILLGQQSFKQCADIYNFLHKYSSCAGTMSQ